MDKKHLLCFILLTMIFFTISFVNASDTSLNSTSTNELLNNNVISNESSIVQDTSSVSDSDKTSLSDSEENKSSNSDIISNNEYISSTVNTNNAQKDSIDSIPYNNSNINTIETNNDNSNNVEIIINDISNDNSKNPKISSNNTDTVTIIDNMNSDSLDNISYVNTIITKTNLENNTKNSITILSEDQNLTYSVINTTVETVTISDNNSVTLKTSTYSSSYDLRDYGYVSSVKDQGTDGNCWSFAAMGTLESCLLKQLGLSYDLSENNLKNLMASNSAYGWLNYAVNNGGYYPMAVGYLASYLGAVLESEDPYVLSSTSSSVIKSTVRINDIYYLTDRTSSTDNDGIKSAILTYGAVSANIYIMQYSPYLKYTNGNCSYYNNRYYGMNHDIVIVGWDDDYSRYNFGITPEGDGAFICKNSWGTDWGNDGYFYVSYYDISITPEFTVDLTNTATYVDNYQYDWSGNSYSVSLYGQSAYYANNFTAINDDPLAAVGTYSTADETGYDMWIYVNNILMHTQSGTFSYAGYHTLALTNTVALSEGDNFQVLLKVYTSRNYINIPTQDSSNCNNTPSGIYSYIGSSLDSLTNTVSYSAVVCLKALTTTGSSKYFDASATDDSGDGSYNNPWKTITQERINSISAGAIAYIANGIYYISNTININKNIIIEGENSEYTIINGQQSGNSVFYINNGIDASISNITITNAKSTNGACIYNNNGVLTVSNSIFTNSTATTNGGAIYSSSGTIILNNNTFNNIESGDETLYLTGTNTLSDNTFKNCSINFSTLTINSNTQIVVGDSVTVTINAGLTNPTYYDSDILNKNSFIVYVNGAEYYTLDKGVNSFVLSGFSTGTITTYVKPSIGQTTSNTQSITINQKSTYIIFNSINGDLTSNTDITANVYDQNNQRVTTGIVYFYSNNQQIGYATVNSGIASIYYSFTSVGQYSITAYYYQNSIYGASSQSTIATISKTVTNINLNTAIGTPLSETLLSVTVTDSSNNQIDKGYIYVYNQDNLISTLDLSTKSNIELNLSGGSYYLTLSYSGTDTYSDSSTTTNFTISKIPITITQDTVNDLIYHMIQLNATLKDYNENLISCGNLTFIDENGINITTVNVINGIASANITFNNIGKHKITVIYNDDTNTYETAEDTIIASFLAESKISINTTTNYTLTNNTITVTVSDLNDNKKITGNVTFKIYDDTNNELIDTYNYLDVNSQTSINFTFSKAGQYDISVIYNGSEGEYLNSTSNMNITIIPINTMVYVDQINAKINDTIQINATINDANGNIVTDGIVYFKINGITIKDANGTMIPVSIENGRAMLNYTVPISWNKNNVFIVAYYNGIKNVTVSSKSTNQTVNVTKRTAIITNISMTSNTKSITSDDNVTFNAIIKDSNGSYVQSGVVTFKLDGVTLKDVNNNIIRANVINGIAKLNYTLPDGLSGRNYTITAIYSDTIYNVVKNDTKQEIKKSNVNITFTAIQKNGTITVIGTIKDKCGHYLIGTNNIVIKVNGITIMNVTTGKSVYSIKNGVINYSISVPGWKKGKLYQYVTVVTGERNAYLGNRTTVYL